MLVTLGVAMSQSTLDSETEAKIMLYPVNAKPAVRILPCM